MSRQRPTLQLAEWRIATNLTATRSVQDDPGYPAHRCDCEWCVEWGRIYAAVLPVEILAQFSRIGIQPDHPMDLYCYRSDAKADYIRVIFSIVGRVMSGPNDWTEDKAFGSLRNYQALRSDPFLSLLVRRHDDLDCDPPSSYEPGDGHYLLVDFRLAIPHAVSAGAAQKEEAQQGVAPNV